MPNTLANLIISMKNHDLLGEEHKPSRRVLFVLRKWILLTAVTLLILLFCLHFLGFWTSSDTEITTKSGKIATKSVGFFYNNQCLLFNQSHQGEVFQSEEEYRNGSDSFLWIILNSFRFTFVDHGLIWWIFGGAAFAIYGFIDLRLDKQIARTMSNIPSDKD